MDERAAMTNLATLAGQDHLAPWVAPGDEQDDFVAQQAAQTALSQRENFELDDEEEIDEEDASSSSHFVPTEAEKDEMARRRAPPAPEAPRPVAAKRPRSPQLPKDDVPDLAEIFDNYDTPAEIRISVCRAYASYVASMQPRQPKKSRVSRKK